MTTNRLEAFSDGVLAIVITIMVLEMKVPLGTAWSDLNSIAPKFLSYILSFVYIGIYWNNHHHLFQAIQKVNGRILWANLFLLFALSLIPFTTGWMGENHFAHNPVILYGLNLLLCALAFVALEKAGLHSDGKSSVIGAALSSRSKEIASVSLYIIGIILSIWQPYLGFTCFCIVAIIWLIPDRRIENQLKR